MYKLRWEKSFTFKLRNKSRNGSHHHLLFSEQLPNKYINKENIQGFIKQNI